MVRIMPFPLSRALRALAETSLGIPLRRLSMRFERGREGKFVSRQANKAGALQLRRDDFLGKLQPKPTADTFFILGAGSSINELTPENFAEIARHRSVGINTWPVHLFVPDFYSFECVSWIGDGLDLSRAFRSLARQDILELKPPVALLRLKTDAEIEQLRCLPVGFEDRIFFYGRVSPSTRKISNLAKDLTWFFEVQRKFEPQVVVDSGASVVRMISLGLALGYRRIVLTGVDLNESPYFWESNEDYYSQLEEFPVYSRQLSATHETQEKGKRPFGVIEFISEISTAFQNQEGFELYISTEKSELAKKLQVYHWE